MVKNPSGFQILSHCTTSHYCKYILCPVRALETLLNSCPLPNHFPLFAINTFPHFQVIDTVVREALHRVLIHKGLLTRGYSFHTFCRSGATFAFDHNVQLQNIMSHGTGCSSAVWSYIQNSSQSASIVPFTFAHNILLSL